MPDAQGRAMGDPDDLKHLEEYFERQKRELEKRKLLEDEMRKKAIQFIKEHTFVLGKANSNREFEEIARYTDRILSLQKRYGCNFYAFVHDGIVLAIPSRNFGVSFSLNLSEIVPHAKRVGENLGDYFEI
jgi:hypothetical protein